MLRHLALLAVVLSSGVSLGADYIADREAAIELAGSGKLEEAQAAFIKMSEGDFTAFQKSDALEQAALCANRLKRYDQAMELAQQIPLEPVSKACQMTIMSSNRKWREVIDKFKDEDIDSWPDWVIGEASHTRGRAYYVTKDGKNAEKDLERAADYLMEDNSKGLALNALGDTYQHLLKDDEKAIAAYRRCYRTRNVYKKSHAAMATASILRRQQKPDEALAELKKLDLDSISNAYWRGAMLCAYGETLASAGKKAEAIARYKEALALEGATSWAKKACEKALKELQGNGD